HMPRQLLCNSALASSSLSILTEVVPTDIRDRTHTPVGAANPAGVGHRSGVDLLAGVADLIGMAAPGCVGPTMEPSSRASRSARSSLLLRSDMSRRARPPICAGIGPTPTETEATGTIARSRYSAAPPRRLLGSFVRDRASIA